MSRRRRTQGWSLVEVMFVVTASAALTVTLLQDAFFLARQQETLAGHADDLRVATDACDRLAREVRVARALASRTPDGRLRLGASALVTLGADGAVTALTLEGSAPRRRLVLTRYAPTGRRVLREDLGAIGDLTLRFDATSVEAVGAVTIDVRLPSRGGRGAPPVLSTRALVGGEVTR